MPASSAPGATALLFPGQGSQTSEMEQVVAEWRPDLLHALRETFGPEPFEGLAGSTAVAQPALYCASIAYWERGGAPEAEMVAGHSLGELAALVGGGALTAADGLRLAIVRGRLMEEASIETPGGMLAVLGGAAEDPITAATRFGLSVANENAPGQVVLSGPLEAIEQARRVLRVEGTKAIRLPVAGAFHSPAMRGAQDRFREELAATEFSEPTATVYSSTTGEPFGDPREGLAAALTSPVRWRLTLGRMREAGAERFLESGPGDVLTGLVRRCLDGVEAEALPEPEGARA